LRFIPLNTILESQGAFRTSLSPWRSRDFARLALAPPAAALIYPFLLRLFHVLVTQPHAGSRALSSLVLLLAIAAPAVGVYSYWKLNSEESPSPIQVRAKLLALFSVAAPPQYTGLGVLLTMAHDPVSDLAVWVVLWLGVSALMLGTRSRDSANVSSATPSLHPRLRFAHGVSAALIVLIFLAMHLTNHLAGLWSVHAERVLMDGFRHVYRAPVVEPILVALILFQISSGPVLAWHYAKRSIDFWRTLQVASGAYVFFYLLSHLNSVFIYARAWAKIPTDWNFATGAPTGLLLDAWNIRLLPHYLLGVFFIVTHLFLGARIVLLAHGVSARISARLVVTGIALAAVLAVAIMLGMVGVHVRS
jgi:hypothetical protein